MNVGFCLFLSSSRRHHPAPSTSEEQTAVGADGDVSGEQAHLAMLNDLLQAGLDPCVRDKQVQSIYSRCMPFDFSSHCRKTVHDN